jgi:Arc/MetJ-type ribon-helix-helix transcriptional regulator|tara:strand:+ start:212 stop:352 length:141 start_codon:yes stop_codon:yes gene_type:complete
MKHKLSITVDEETVFKIMEAVRNRQFRNKSHAFEYSVNKVLEEKNE